MDPATVQSDIDRRRMARKIHKEQGAIAAERERMAEWLATYHRSAQAFYNEEGINQAGPNQVITNEDDHDEEEYDDEYDEEDEYEDEDFE